jgi:hypothetical protein
VLLPVLLGFVAVLSQRVLPRRLRPRRGRRVALAAAVGPVVAVALVWVGIALGL